MNEFLLIVIIAGVLGIFVFYRLWYLPRKQRRTKNLIRIGMRHRFRFVEDLDAAPKEKFAPLRLFSLGSPGKMKNVLTRSNPSTWVFDYEYSIPRDQDVGQTVALIESRETRWPPIVIESRKRERFTVAAMRMVTQKIANWQHGYKEIDVSFHPEFAKNYRIFYGNDPKELKGTFTAPLLDFLSRNSGWNVEAMNQWLLIYRHGKYVKPEQFDAFIDSVLAICNLIED